MSLILAIEPDAAQADAVRRAVRSLPGVDLILVDSRDAAVSILKGRVPEMILLSALLGPGDEAALTASLRTAPGAGHVEMITIPLLEHGPGFDEGRRGLFGFGKRRVSNQVRIKPSAFGAELRAHLDRIAETVETHALVKRRREQENEATPAAVDESTRDSEPVPLEREWSGPSDVFGDRAFSVDDEGAAVELLRLSTEFAAARDAISDRMVRLMAVDRAALGQALRLETEPDSGRVILVSERVPGVRVSTLLALASDRLVVPDLPAALFVMQRLLLTAASVYARTGIAHLAIGPERTVVTPRGEIVIVEAALAAAIEARSFSIDEASASRDLKQIALIGLSVMLGRPVGADADMTARTSLVAEAADVATIRVNEAYAAALQTWFDRALANDDTASFRDFREAADALASASPSRVAGTVALRRTLRGFLEEVGAAGAPDDAQIEAARIRVARARQISHRGAFAHSVEPLAEFNERPEATAEVSEEVFPPIERDLPVATYEPPIEPPPPEIPADTRRPTLLELFRSARSGDADRESMPPPSIFKDPGPSFVAPAETPDEPAIVSPAPEFSEAAIPESPVAVFADDARPAEFVETPIVEPLINHVEAVEYVEPVEAVEPLEHVEHVERVDAAVEAAVVEFADAAAEPVVASEPVPEIIADEPAAPPPVPADPPPAERRRPSILELFRTSKPRQRVQEPEPEPDHAPIPADTAPLEPFEAPLEEPAAHTLDAHEPVHAPEPSIFRQQITIADISVEPFVEPAPDVAPEVEPAHVEAPVEVAEPEEAARPRRASLLEFLRTSRFGKSKHEPEVASPPPPEPEPDPPAVAHPTAPAPAINEPLHDVFAELIHAARSASPDDPPPATKPQKKTAVEDEWTTDEPPSAPIPDPSEWSDWNAPEAVHVEPAEERPADTEPAVPREKFRLPDEDEWPTWNALESPEPQASHEQEVARQPHDEEVPDEWTAHEEEAPHVDEPPLPPAPKPRKPSLLEVFRSSRAEDAQDTPRADRQIPPPVERSPDAFVDDVVAQFDAFAASTVDSVPPPRDIPAFADVPPPLPIQPRAQPTFAPPPPAYVLPQAPYVPPPPPPSAPPIGFAPSIGIEAPPRLAPIARQADFGQQQTYAPQQFRGPVTRKSAPGASGRGWAPIAGTAIAIVLVAIAGRAYYFSAPSEVATSEEKVSKPTTVNARGTGSVAITSEPPGARVTIDGKPRGATPVTVANLRPGTHKVVLDSSSGTVRREVKVIAGREVSLDESIYAGWVAVYAPFELQVSEGSRLVGTTDNQIMLAPGRHQLELTNRQLGYHETRGVEVTPGETTTINIKAAEGIVRINAPDGAEVWIDGERVGQTPLADLRVPVGARDIVVRHPELGEQHTVANVTIGARAEVTIEFKRPKIPNN